MRTLLRRLLPERLRLLAHPYPSLRETLLYPERWQPAPRGNVLILGSIVGSAMMACGGTLAEWAQGEATVHLAWEKRPDNDHLLEAGRRAATVLGVATTHLVSVMEVEALARKLVPSVVIAPGLFSGFTNGSPTAKWLEVCSRAARPKHVGFHDGDGPGAVNVLNELSEGILEKRRQALGQISEELVLAADGLSEYRGFTAGFFRGHAEAFLRLDTKELKRLRTFLE